MKVVAVFMDRLKAQKTGLDNFIKNYNAMDLRFIYVDHCDSLDQLNHVDAVVQKIPELLHCLSATQEQRLAAFLKFLNDHPAILCIDVPDSIFGISRRDHQFNLVGICMKNTPYGVNVHVPNWCLLERNDLQQNREEMKQTRLHFPLICKPRRAHGKFAHEMSIIFNEDSLKQLEYPIVVQQFVNHGGLIYKMFVIGDHVAVRIRSSIKNLESCPSSPPIVFNTKSVSDESSAPVLSQPSIIPESAYTELQQSMTLFEGVASVLRKALQLDLFGVDMIRCDTDNSVSTVMGDTTPELDREEVEGKWAIVDVNYFPSYKNVPHFHHHFENLVRQKLSLPLCSTLTP